MRKMKRFLSLMLAVVMMLAMSVPVSVEAASDYIITVENSVTDKSYSAYKIFDATYDSTASGSGVTYTIKSTDDWYSLVTISGLFTLTETATNGTYTVTIASGKSGSDVAAWIQELIAAGTTIPVSASATGTGNGGSLELEVQSAGYYFITTETGSTVTVTTAAPTAKVVDKNQEPGDDLEKTADKTTASIGETVTYTITSNVPAYDGTTEIKNYTFVDTLSDGLTAPAESAITVQILDANNSVWAPLTSSYITVSGQEITISYDPTTLQSELNVSTAYPADATIKITYTATVNAEAAYKNNNSVSQKWTGNSTGETDDYDVYTYGFNLIKKAETENGITLSGAEFTLKDSNGDPVYVVVDSDGNYRVATSSTETGATTTITAGSVYIKGLAAGTYTLTETTAPTGYNKIDDSVTVVVGENGNYYTTGIYLGINTEATTVVNNAGTTLPESGGMGTTILYIIGGILVIGAAILLITRRRMSQTGAASQS